MQLTHTLHGFGALFVPDPGRQLRGQFYQVLCLVSALLTFGLVIPTNML